MDGHGAGEPETRLSLLLARRGSLANTRLRAALGAAGLTPRHVMALTHLAPEPACQQGLVEMLDVDPSVLVAILNDLERGELICRRRDPADRRRHIVEITPAGAETLRALDAALAEAEDHLFADLSEQERETLTNLLARVGKCPGVGDGLKTRLGILR